MPQPARAAALAIASSTGGPQALISIFKEWKGHKVAVPVFITQHMPPNFTAILADHLSKAADMDCHEAKNGEEVVAGKIYLAPGDFHMTIERDGNRLVLRLDQSPPENFCRPAVDPMLRSISRVYGAGVVAAIFTGMGNDGAKGCEVVAKAGGRFIVQDEATSVVWGMPGAAAATGLAESILPVSDIAPWLRRSMEIA